MEPHSSTNYIKINNQLGEATVKYLVFIALVCVALVGELARAGRLSTHDEWTLFKSKHGKCYESQADDARRFAIFRATKQRVERHNAQKNSSFELGLNQLSDWTEEELARLTGYKVDESYLIKAQENMGEYEAYLAEILGSSSEPVPDEFDWRKVPGRVSEVKNQGECSSSWAFATIGVLEGQEMGRVLNKSGDVIKLSEQQLVDCSVSNGGCNSGLPAKALDDLSWLGGVESSEDYPYTTKEDKCKFDKSKVAMKNAGHVMLPTNDEDKVKEVLFKYGPIEVGIDSFGIFSYKSGIYDNADACAVLHQGLNHAILLVGYGVDPKHGDFWIAKNSWGTRWGEKGYMRIARGVNMCVIGYQPAIAKF